MRNPSHDRSMIIKWRRKETEQIVPFRSITFRGGGYYFIVLWFKLFLMFSCWNYCTIYWTNNIFLSCIIWHLCYVLHNMTFAIMSCISLLFEQLKSDRATKINLAILSVSAQISKTRIHFWWMLSFFAIFYCELTL